ncbi:unnamed protein product, partial [Amoebophrya sp. A120]
MWPSPPRVCVFGEGPRGGPGPRILAALPTRRPPSGGGGGRRKRAWPLIGRRAACSPDLAPVSIQDGRLCLLLVRGAACEEEGNRRNAGAPPRVELHRAGP